MGRGVSPSPKPPEKVRDQPLPVLQNCTAPHNGHHKKIRQALDPLVPVSYETLPLFQIRPINLVVYQGSYSLKGMGELILRPASRLDAFSGYPIHT